MIKIYNGTGKLVPFDAESIIQEAGFDTGHTSIVFGHYGNNKISFSQHECGEWDLSINEETIGNEDEPNEIVVDFMNFVQHGETDYFEINLNRRK